MHWGIEDKIGDALINNIGVTYTIDTTIPSHCVSDEKENFRMVNGERRVKNVKVEKFGTDNYVNPDGDGRIEIIIEDSSVE